MINYPQFIVFELTETGPLVSTFETARETAEHLKGRYQPRLAVFKDRNLVHLESTVISDIEKQLSGERDKIEAH